MIEVLTAEQARTAVSALAEVLQSTVAAGGAVSFVLPFAKEDAVAFFEQKVFPAVERRECILFAARHEGRIMGTVQLWTAMPPNQPHRAEVAKLLVHPDARRRGLGRKLMSALEGKAITLGKTLITLDTRTDSFAFPLYRSMDYQITGEVPNFAVNPDGDGYHPATYMYKMVQSTQGL